MSRPVSSPKKTTSKPALKNPLRASTMSLLGPSAVSEEPESPGRAAAEPAPKVTAQQLRRMQISEFSAWLRTQTSRDKRPFQEETIRGYAETARALDLWMAAEDIDGDFTACSVDVLNGFFAAYRNAHSQGGTNTRQRNLHHLFKWLALRYGHPDPWTDDMVRYGPVKSRPSTLAEDFIRDLLEVTGGGKATSFAPIGPECVRSEPGRCRRARCRTTRAAPGIQVLLNFPLGPEAGSNPCVRGSKPPTGWWSWWRALPWSMRAPA